MRIEPFSVGSVVHVIKRGARGMDIVQDDADRWRFVRTLYLLNDTHQDNYWSQYEFTQSIFDRPGHWPERDPLCAVLAWTLMPNHFHLLLIETREGGVSKFMQRLCGSMTTAYNEKYDETGSIFQGAYKSRTVDTDEYLRYVLAYVVVKNVFELYPDGLGKATREFSKAWRWAETYPFSSFQTTAGRAASPIVDTVRLNALGLPGKSFKKDALDMLTAHTQSRDDLARLHLEDW